MLHTLPDYPLDCYKSVILSCSAFSDTTVVLQNESKLKRILDTSWFALVRNTETSYLVCKKK